MKPLYTQRLAVLESVIEKGRSAGAAARLHAVNRSTADRWLAEHRTGKFTIQQVRERVAAIPSEKETSLAVYEMPDTRELSRGALLESTAAYVLHPSAPIEHFETWLRFFVEEYL